MNIYSEQLYGQKLSTNKSKLNESRFAQWDILLNSLEWQRLFWKASKKIQQVNFEVCCNDQP